MEIFANFVLVLYMIALVIITLYCLMQFHLLYHFIRGDKDEFTGLDPEDLPMVTVQLPMFNEKYVVKRLIDNIASLDYPKEKLEIQVLDDSTDDTVSISQERVDHYKNLGYNIELLTRTDRTGYKAGALKEATPKAKGDFIAIFDADFLPEKNFLQKCMPFFNDPSIGVVQTRWGHINEDYSLLTRLQAFQLNVHFTVEQAGREGGDLLLQFNGTAGVWRKKTIEDAGGWSADTLTEDLDLSYRAQMKGWKIRFLEEVISPAELPAEMGGLKSQQFRWMKGGAETARKMLPAVWKSDLGLFKKLHASAHLLSSSIFLCVFVLGLMSVPLLVVNQQLNISMDILSAFMISTLSVLIVYFVANVFNDIEGSSRWKLAFKFLIMFPFFLALSMGLSLHNSIAVMQGYMGKKSAFIRTPKFNLNTIKDKVNMKSYLTLKLSPLIIMEGLLCIYFSGAIAFAVWSGNYHLVFLHVLLAFGYGSIFFISVKHLSLNKG